MKWTFKDVCDKLQEAAPRLEYINDILLSHKRDKRRKTLSKSECLQIIREVYPTAYDFKKRPFGAYVRMDEGNAIISIQKLKNKYVACARRTA